ncbi:MAG: thiosulfate oxidation carrier protein SoxY [Pseudomonadota bacterium]
MKMTKRQFMAAGAASAVAAVLGLPIAEVHALANETNDRINRFTGGKKPVAGKLEITIPEIAENGNSVPITVDVESPMEADNYVEAVLIVADGNPLPGVATFRFTPMSGEATAMTRIRLAQTQNVIAIAKMSDGSMHMDKKQVKVTIGGCGG